MKNNKGNMLIAIATGAAIGAGLAILYAPDKGSKTRGNIKRAAKDTSQDVTDWLKHAKDELAQSAHDNKVAFEKKIEHTMSNMSQKAEDILSSIDHKLSKLKG